MIDNLGLFLTRFRKHRLQTSTLKEELLKKNHVLAFNKFYQSITGRSLSANDIKEYCDIFNFNKMVNKNNISKIFTIYFSLLKVLAKTYNIDKNIKYELHQRFFNVIGKNNHNINLLDIVSEGIRHRAIVPEVRTQLWAIYKSFQNIGKASLRKRIFKRTII
jgi:hypothetical protein